MKNTLTQAGFEPATFRFVAQHLNHCVTAVPYLHTVHTAILERRERKEKKNSVYQLHNTETFDLSSKRIAKKTLGLKNV